MLRTKGKKSSLDSIGSHRWRFAVHRGDMADIICKVCVKYRWKTLNAKNQSIAIWYYLMLFVAIWIYVNRSVVVRSGTCRDQPLTYPWAWRESPNDKHNMSSCRLGRSSTWKFSRPLGLASQPAKVIKVQTYTNLTWFYHMFSFHSTPEPSKSIIFFFELSKSRPNGTCSEKVRPKKCFLAFDQELYNI